MTTAEYDNFSRHLEVAEKAKFKYWPHIICTGLVLGFIFLVFQNRDKEKEPAKEK